MWHIHVSELQIETSIWSNFKSIWRNLKGIMLYEKGKSQKKVYMLNNTFGKTQEYVLIHMHMLKL